MASVLADLSQNETEWLRVTPEQIMLDWGKGFFAAPSPPRKEDGKLQEGAAKNLFNMEEGKRKSVFCG
ncbi:MAG: hypothetical protein PHI29_13295 [Gallionella sp.]|nr:hypothetical protein [Gallionella sp.]